MPHASSNMPSSIFYASIGAEILRISRATTDRNSFFLSSNCFLSRMIKQGANIQQVERVLKRTFGRYNKELLYVANNSTDFLKSLFP